VHVTLVQCLPAADKMDFVVQKAVELGVSAIQPVAAKRSVIRLSGERMERRVAHWQNVAVAACEQSGRNVVPTVAPIFDLPQYLGHACEQNELRLICLPSGGVRLRDLDTPARLTVMIGPEGGFEESEVKAALAAGFQPLGLGPRVLRTETAGPASLAAIMSLWGDI
jgi:16S rRNA (uracil1498-N3)-methyltransferase